MSRFRRASLCVPVWMLGAMLASGLFLSACGGTSQQQEEEERAERVEDTRGRADAAFDGAGMHSTGSQNGTSRGNGNQTGPDATRERADDAFRGSDMHDTGQQGGRSDANAPTTSRGDREAPTTGGRQEPPTTRGDREGPTTGDRTNRELDTEQEPTVSDARVRRWFEQRNDPDYPESEYLIGVGSGPNPDAAVRAARQDMLAFFSAELEGVGRTVSESIQRIEGENQYVKESLHSMRDTRQVVSGSLEGSRVAGMGKHHGQDAALVVLNRANFIQNARSSIEQKEREIGDIMSNARQLLDRGQAVHAMRTLTPAFRLQTEVLTLIEQHNLISSENLQPTYTAAQIEELILGFARDLTMMLRIDVQVRDEQDSISERPAGDVVERIQRSLTQEGSGIQVLQSSSELRSASVDQLRRASASEIAAMTEGASFVVYGTVEAGFNQMRHGRLYEYSGTFDLTVLEVATGQTWRVSDQSGRDSLGANRSERPAIGTALERAANRIGHQIVERMVRGN